MKKRTLLTCGLAAALFAGCSSDDKLTVDDGTVSNGTGYVSLRIALPTTSGGNGGMRADNQGNDQFHHGSSDEYKVNDITLIFFDQNNKYVETHKLTNAGNWSAAPGTATGITTDYTIPAQQVSENVKKVLVLLNTPSGVNTSPNSFEAFNTALTATDVKALIGDTKDDFFMSNTTIAIEGEDPMTLVPVETKNTAAEAVAAAHTIHVERAVGKVSISHETTSGDWNSGWTYTVPASSTVHPGDKIEIKNWVLDNTNTQYYPVRKFNKAWGTLETAASTTISPNRFQSNAASYVAYKPDGSVKNGYRTYWAEDPNYDQDATTLNKFDPTYNDAEGIEEINQDLATNLYCLENTFDVKRMKQQNTTCAVLKAQYTPNITGYTAGDDWYLIGNSTIPRTKAQVIAAANEAIAGSDPVTDVTFNNGKTTSFTAANFTGASDAQVTTIATYLGSVTKYTKGYCYYIVRIQHFGSIYTPWGGEPSSWGSTTDEKYVDYTTSSDTYLEGKYLGRYGIVRNNWYELELGTISGPGDPEKPSSTTDPDDTKKTYISATVKIMDWAVRKQSVDL